MTCEAVSISSQINVPYLKPDRDTMNALFILFYTVIEIHQKKLVCNYSVWP